MKKVLLIFILAISCPFEVYSQGETANWYFGNGAGLHFNNDGSVSVLTDGRLNTLEGCTTISDNEGDLLFYTDGITVYNRNHSIMENGTRLYGDPSSTQSALIIPKPEDSNIFYIFTVDTTSGDIDIDPDYGLNYSIVDMSQNSGNGAVIKKNIPLLEDSSEKITGVIKDCSNKSIWLLTLASETGEVGYFNTFHAFEINETGVVTTAIKSIFSDLELYDPRGYLKLSADGTKIASANATGGLYIYNFDSDTGIVSNQQKIELPIDNYVPYGVEFSQSNQYLYVHSYNDLAPEILTGHTSSLLQFDLSAVNIAASQEILDTKPIYRGALQLASNGKIYRTISTNYIEGTSFLGVINNPDKKGVDTNYSHNSVSLNGKFATQGLPPFIQSFFNKIDLIKNPDNTTSSSQEICEGEELILEGKEIAGATYAWSLDNIKIAGETNYFYKISKTEAIDAGRYQLKIAPSDIRECPIIGEALIKVNPLPNTSTIDLTQCDADANPTDGITTINIEEVVKDDIDNDYFFYKTIADRNADIPIKTPKKYTNTKPNTETIYYKIINTSKCENFGELILNIKPIDLTIEAPEYIYECNENTDDTIIAATFELAIYAVNKYTQPQNFIFYPTIEDAILEQNPLPDSFKTESVTIYGREENANQCKDIFELNLIVNPLPLIDLKSTYFVCTDDPNLTISGPDGFDSYNWLKIDTNSSQEISSGKIATITEPGTYSLKVSTIYIQNGYTSNCSDIKTFEVLPSSIASIKNIEIKDISNSNTVEVFVLGNGNYEYSIDGVNYQQSSFFENVLPGFTTVYIKDTKNDCGIVKTKISVIGYPKFFTPNGDNANNTWQIIGVDGMFQANSKISIFNRYGNLITQITPTSNGWDGTSNGQPLPASNYWFKVNLEDGRIFKGHFALKR